MLSLVQGVSWQTKQIDIVAFGSIGSVVHELSLLCQGWRRIRDVKGWGMTQKIRHHRRHQINEKRKRITRWGITQVIRHEIRCQIKEEWKRVTRIALKPYKKGAHIVSQT